MSQAASEQGKDPEDPPLSRPSVVIPLQQLPRGYTGSWRDDPVIPVKPRPAATLALLRQPPGGEMEILLLERSQRTRFIPGAYVFPGGRVDVGDIPGPVSPEVGGVQGAGPANAGIGLEGFLPESAYLLAALRETFEETGVLLSKDTAPTPSFPVWGDSQGSGLRRSLHAGEASFSEVLEALGVEADPDRLVPIGHWVTPVQESHRYDTLFFATEIRPDCQVHPDGIEMVEALWVSPAEALSLNRAGRLPLVFPTFRTLEALLPFSNPGEAIRSLGAKKTLRLLPKVEKTEGGIRVTLDPSGEAL